MNPKKIIIPKGTEAIEYKQFCGNQEIESIELPEGLQRIEEFAFFGCTALKKNRNSCIG